MPDALGPQWPQFLAEHEARWERAIAEDAARARRREINAAILALCRAEELRIGWNRSDYLDQAARALLRADLPEHVRIIDAADDIGGDDSDLRRLRAELEEMAKGLPR